MERQCRVCGTVKPLTEFYKTGRKNGDERHYECKECAKARVKQRHCPETYRRQHLKRAYGITPEQYDELLEKQNGKCACCGADKPGNSRRDKYFAVDHDHSTGKVRGLLCHNCNTALGLIRDNPQTLTSMLTYLASAATN